LKGSEEIAQARYLCRRHFMISRRSQFVRVLADAVRRRTKSGSPIIALDRDIGIRRRDGGVAQEGAPENDKQQKPLHISLQIRAWVPPWKFLHSQIFLEDENVTVRPGTCAQIKPSPDFDSAPSPKGYRGYCW
jgi:voltage-gated potassium channel Kch